jgi:hypothetical protein
MKLFNIINKQWKERAFDIILIFTIMVLIIFGIINKFIGKKGNWININDVKSLYNNNGYRSYYSETLKKTGSSKGEIECKRVLENIFNKPFNKERPDFLYNNVIDSGNLELDCYNKELKLAVEYNGKQHYEYTPFFHKNKESFYNQKYRDAIKRQKCKENGIKLIEVPYTVKIQDIERYIKDKIK